MGGYFAKPATSIGVVGAAFDKGQPKAGVNKGSDTLREGGVNGVINAMEAKVVDYGNVSQTQPKENEIILGCRNQRALVKSALELAELVHTSVAENEITLVLGGDHSLAIGSILGQCAAYPNTFVVWVDAHADINPPLESPSGNTHGMPLCFLIEECRDKIPQINGFEKIKPCLKAENLLYIGLRDVDTPEWQVIKDCNIRYFSMENVRKLGIEKVMQLTLKAIAAQPHCQIHLSYDIDSLDPVFAASTGTPVPGGLTLEEGKFICQTLAMTGQLRAVDLAEVNPELGTADEVKTTVASGVEIIKSCLQRP